MICAYKVNTSSLELDNLPLPFLAAYLWPNISQELKASDLNAAINSDFPWKEM